MVVYFEEEVEKIWMFLSDLVGREQRFGEARARYENFKAKNEAAK